MSDRDTLTVPPESSRLPEFDRGWIADDASKRAFLKYRASTEVHWSDTLEELHEESSRSHFLDVFTRQAALDRLGSFSDGARLADIGCSSGYLLEDLRTRHAGASLYGVDLVASGLRRAHQRLPDVRFLQADVTELPFANGSLDALVCLNLLEHVSDDMRAMREMLRVLRPGGRAVVVVPFGANLFDYYDEHLGHQRRYRRRELAAKAETAGFEVTEEIFLGSLLYLPFWVVKRNNRRRGPHGGEAREQVERAIAISGRLRLARLLGSMDKMLLRAGIPIPFGVRALGSWRRPELKP